MLAYTVPAYRRVLDHAGHAGTADAVMAAASAGRRSQARDLIEEGYLDLLGVITATEKNAIERGLEPWRPLAQRISLSVPWFGSSEAEQLIQIRRLIAELAVLHKV